MEAIQLSAKMDRLMTYRGSTYIFRSVYVCMYMYVCMYDLAVFVFELLVLHQVARGYRLGQPRDSHSLRTE